MARGSRRSGTCSDIIVIRRPGDVGDKSKESYEESLVEQFARQSSDTEKRIQLLNHLNGKPISDK